MHEYEGLFRKGLEAHQKGEYENAVELYKRSYAKCNKESHGKYIKTNIASAQYSLGLNHAAAESVKEALKLDPGYAEAIRMAARVSRAIEEVKPSREFYAIYLKKTLSQATSVAWQETAVEFLSLVAEMDDMSLAEESLSWVRTRLDLARMTRNIRIRYALYLVQIDEAQAAQRVISHGPNEYDDPKLEYIGQLVVNAATRVGQQLQQIAEDRALQQLIGQCDDKETLWQDLFDTMYQCRLRKRCLELRRMPVFSCLKLRLRTYHLCGVVMLETEHLSSAYRDFSEILEAYNWDPASEYYVSVCGFYWSLLELAKNPYYQIPWKLYDERVRLQCEKITGRKTSNPYPSLPSWQPDGRFSHLLLSREQGIGEQILFMRLLPLFLTKYPTLRVTVEINPKIACIAREIAGSIGVQLVCTGERVNFDDKGFDSHLLIGSCLQYAFDDSVRPDLSRDIDRRKIVELLNRQYGTRYSSKRLPDKRARRKRIGIFWRGNRSGAAGANKNIALELLKPILRLEADIISLQPHMAEDELSVLIGHGVEIPEVDCYNDIHGLCEILGKLDCLVTSSATVAHLAGHIGIKTFVLAPSKSAYLYWYWGSDPEKRSLFYPSVQIERGIDDDAADVINCVAREINAGLV